MKNGFDKNGCYIVMGVGGEDTLYFQFENARELNKAMQGMIRASIKAEFAGKKDLENNHEI